MAGENKPENTPQPRKLVAVPFVADGFTAADKPRFWRSPVSKANPNPTRVGVHLGTVTMRIAGSQATFPVQIGVAFENAGSDIAPRIQMPTGEFGRGSLFTFDTPQAAADLERAVADAGTQFYAWYTKNHASKLPLATIDHKYVSDRVGTTGVAAKIR